MDLSFLADYAIPLVAVFCLCIGYILKNLIPTDKINKFIPLIMGLCGLLMNIWINMGISPTIVVTGIFSGLASTGMYEAFVNIIKKKDK